MDSVEDSDSYTLSPIQRQAFRETDTLDSTSQVDNSPKKYDADPCEWLCSSPMTTSTTRTSLTTPSLKLLQDKFASGALVRSYQDRDYSIPSLPDVHENTSDLRTPDLDLSDNNESPPSSSRDGLANYLNEADVTLDQTTISDDINSEQIPVRTSTQNVSLEQSFDDNNELSGDNTPSDVSSAEEHDEVVEAFDKHVSRHHSHDIASVTSLPPASKSFAELQPPTRTISQPSLHEGLPVANDISFGETPLLTSSPRSIPLRNTSKSSITLSFTLPPSSCFSCSPFSISIPPLSSASIVVSFYPKEVGHCESLLKVARGSDTVMAFSLSGVGVNATSSVPVSSPSVTYTQEESSRPLFTCPNQIKLKRLPLKSPQSITPDDDQMIFSTFLSIKIFPTDSSGSLITNHNLPHASILSLISSECPSVPPKGNVNVKVAAQPKVEGEFSAVIVIESVINDSVSFSEAVNVSGTIVDTRAVISHASIEYGVIPLLYQQNSEFSRTVEVFNKSKNRCKFLVAIKNRAQINDYSDDDDDDVITSTPFILDATDSPHQQSDQSHVILTLDPNQSIKVNVLANPVCTLPPGSKALLSLRNELSVRPERFVATLGVYAVVDLSSDTTSIKQNSFEILLSSCVLSMRVGAPRIQVHKEAKSKTKMIVSRTCEILKDEFSTGTSLSLSSAYGKCSFQIRNGGHVSDELSFKIDDVKYDSGLNPLIGTFDIQVDPSDLVLHPNTVESVHVAFTLPVNQILDDDVMRLKNILTGQEPVEITAQIVTFSQGHYLFSTPLSILLSFDHPTPPLDIVCDKPILSFGVVPIGQSSKSSLVVRNNSLPQSNIVSDLFFYVLDIDCNQCVGVSSGGKRCVFCNHF
ncbi:hypothetical protein GEMRC1_007464 [Eukaryota sp. GEM-RC1]